MNSINLRNIRQRWINGSQRSKLAVKNIIMSFFLKGTSILSSLFIVPLTISYIDSTQYGIWLTISSIVAWANFFDLGLANGFRNRFTQSLASGDIKLAQQYVSTTYMIISIIMCFVLTVILCINNYLDWPSILKIDDSYRLLLHKVFMILIIFFCLNMIVNVFVKLLEADQRPAIAAVISCIGQVLSLCSIYLLTQFTEGSLIKLALYFSSIPFMTMLVASILMFNFTRYKKFRPSINGIKLSLIKNIMGLGVKFFVIYLCLIVVFHLMNIVISRDVGPLAVTQYNIANKYFSIIYMVSAIIVAPMWSAFTDAYSRKDYKWMVSTVSKLEKWVLIAFGLCIIACVVSPLFYKIWIGNRVSIPFFLSISVMVFIMSQIGANIYTTLICGVGHMRLQTYIYLGAALVSFPLMTLCCRKFGVVGITIIPTTVYLLQSIICRIQLIKIIKQKAEGIWVK